MNGHLKLKKQLLTLSGGFLIAPLLSIGPHSFAQLNKYKSPTTFNSKANATKKKFQDDESNADTFGGWSVGDDGRQRISLEKMVLPLIKAVQELSAEVEKLKNK